jgi:small-conductance mechanosensitive channel
LNPQDAVAELEAYFANASRGEIVSQVIWSLVVVVGLLIVRRAIGRLLDKRFTDPADRYRWNKVLRSVTWAVIAVIVAAIWLDGVSGLATVIAIIAAGLAIALRDPIVDLGGWLYISGRHPFKVGDRIAIAGERGDVVDISPFVFTLMQVGDAVAGTRQSTGRLVLVPNKFIFTNPLVNENLVFDYIWHEIPVVVTFESDWQRAKEILEETVNRHAAHLAPDAEAQAQASLTQYMVSVASFEPRVFTRAVNSGVELTMRFLCEVRQPREMEMAIWEDVLRAFADEPRIDLAYTTSRVVRNTEEGKPALGGPGDGDR